jgi:hypothetical protein
MHGGTSGRLDISNGIALAVTGLAIAMILSLGERPASAEVDATVAVGCEFLEHAIDGDKGDVTTAADRAAACDGVNQAEVANLASALGDLDDILEPGDLAALDVDANQVADSGASISIFAFVDNDAQFVFDAEVGLTTSVNHDGTGGEAFPAADANSETCDGPDDLDCGTTTADNGDGVVVQRSPLTPPLTLATSSTSICSRWTTWAWC